MPVFELATDILDVLVDGPDEIQTPVIVTLVKAVEDTRRLEGHDLSGRLFHTLLTDAKFTGAYDTSVPAATLLSRLVFHDWPAHVDWRDHEFPASLNVANLDSLVKVCVGRIRTNVPTPGYNIQCLFRTTTPTYGSAQMC